MSEPVYERRRAVLMREGTYRDMHGRELTVDGALLHRWAEQANGQPVEVMHRQMNRVLRFGGLVPGSARVVGDRLTGELEILRDVWAAATDGGRRDHVDVSVGLSADGQQLEEVSLVDLGAVPGAIAFAAETSEDEQTADRRWFAGGTVMGDELEKQAAGQTDGSEAGGEEPTPVDEDGIAARVLAKLRSALGGGEEKPPQFSAADVAEQARLAAEEASKAAFEEAEKRFAAELQKRDEATARQFAQVQTDRVSARIAEEQRRGVPPAVARKWAPLLFADAGLRFAVHGEKDAEGKPREFSLPELAEEHLALHRGTVPTAVRFAAPEDERVASQDRWQQRINALRERHADKSEAQVIELAAAELDAEEVHGG